MEVEAGGGGRVEIPHSLADTLSGASLTFFDYIYAIHECLAAANFGIDRAIFEQGQWVGNNG